MRVLFLTKQRYMGKDLLRDRFGRFYEFPRALAGHGHRVRVVCLSYWIESARSSASPQYLDGVEWRSFPLGWNWAVGFLRHFRRLKEIAREFEPEIVVGASDAAHVIMADSLSARLGVPLVVDLFDNFESYGATKLPGMKRRLKRGICNAAATSAVSHALAEKIKIEYGAPGIVRTITNAVCPEIFYPSDKNSARRELGLPESGLLIGTAGALSAERGTRDLLHAFEKLSHQRRNLHLVLAGRTGREMRIPANPRIKYLGDLPHAHIGRLFNALDVGVVCNRHSPFGEYCFPQKFYEMIACGLPVVAADVGAMRALLVGYENCLYDPNRAGALTAAIEKQLIDPRVANINAPSWKTQGRDFHDLLEQALSARRAAKHGVSTDDFRPQHNLN